MKDFARPAPSPMGEIVETSGGSVQNKQRLVNREIAQDPAV
ncbi:hypothetical protein ABB02_01250 [Clostridiaceae bacterium JG1575]|nr:hypothetical protein ABB02_01250 [Clostridiaceae bacterium JG1575]